MKETVNKYSLLNNIRYSYRTLFRKCPMMRLGVGGTVATELVGNVVRTVTLAAVVASITEKGKVSHYLLVMAVMLAAYLVSNFLSQYIREWSSFYYENTQNREFLMRLVKKSLRSDYVNVESPAQQRLLTRASHAVHMYRQGVNQIYNNTPMVIANIIGIILYSLTITLLDYRILIVMLVMSAVSAVLEANARRFRANKMDDRYRIWGRFWYLKQQTISVANGKDIRIYNMANWFRKGFDRLAEKNKALTIQQAKRQYAANVSDIVFTAIRDILAYGILTAQAMDGQLSIAKFTLGLGVITGLSGWLWSIRYYIDHLLEGNRMMCEYRKMMDYPNKFSSPILYSVELSIYASE